ncbi:MAG: ISAzo13 family transposase, partial [Vicinamibacterales bacterium]
MQIGEDVLARKLTTILPFLNERQRRLLLAAEAVSLGRGGAAAVARAAGVSRPTVFNGIAELDSADPTDERVRRPGGGRKPAEKTDPKLLKALERLVDPHTRGAPMSPLRWTTKSTRTLAAELTRQGYAVSHFTVARLLHDAHYSLQANAKTIEGKQHPDRDAQFRHINATVARFLRSGDPVVSVDTKKKELVGSFKNAGKTWRPAGEPQKVKVHDFADKDLGKAIPYGVYDVGA